MKLFRLVFAAALTAFSVSMVAPAAEVAELRQGDLEFLGGFETLHSLGFTPDDVAYNPQGGRLLVTASADSGVGARGVFEVAQDGRLVDAFTLPEPSATVGLLGFSITRVSAGPRVGNYFMADFNGLPTVTVFEFDPTFTIVNRFPLTGSASPGDAIAFNHLTQHLLVPDGGTNEMIEITTSGELVRRSNRNVHANGIAFNQSTGTYFIVSGGLAEMSTDGEQLRTFDLTPFGIRGAVGVAYGQGKLFIADEGEPANSSGAIYIFRSPRRSH